jgi:hypothetical protein
MRSTPDPEPQPRRRRKDETGRGFRATALAIFRRAVSTLPFPAVNPAWEPFTWLRLWDWHDSGSGAYQDYVCKGPPPDLPPHL